MTKNVFITGASRGIGKAIAHAFAKEGYHLYLLCKNNLTSMQEYASFLEKEYCVQTHCYAADLADSQALESLLDTLPDMDVIVNNAGISYVGLLTDMTICDWNQIINTNLTSAFVICRKFLPGMIQRRSGHILNISSVWGNVGASMEVAYSTSKGGLNSFTKALAKEVAPSQIQVNAIACGLIDTDMNACFSEEDLDNVVAEIPADRMGRPEEVAELCLQLVQAPGYLTGQIISLDGGWI
jgi:3-oxoacyl-[acyl-carrier protein] reductase